MFICESISHSLDSVFSSVMNAKPSFVSQNTQAGNNSFALGSAIADGNSALALRILATIKAQKIDPVAVMGELSKTLADMLTVKLMASAGLHPKDIATAIRTRSDYRVKLYMGKVRDLSAEKLSRAVDMCVDADIALKQSSAGYIEIEKLICAL